MMRTFYAWIILVLIGSSVFAARQYVLVLGIGQDAGVPQMGCDSPFCRSAWQNPMLQQTVSSIALVDPDSGKRWIFDATPDLPEQFELLQKNTNDRSTRIDGIFLTHAHIGHYTGLMYLGRESMNAKNVPVFAMPRMAEMLRKNAPWSQLVDIKNIELRQLSNDEPVRLNDQLTVTPFIVPHRDEFSETVGYRISTKTKSLIFIPDIDKWEKWKTRLADVLATTNFALLDGTFFTDGEISRPMNEVPHPFVTETIELLKALPIRERKKVHFIHFNHSNPIVQGKRDAIDTVRRSASVIARAGMKFDL
ncbi:MAG: MBL fold metallo-hydrolase [Pyrinomonadaceae bacterium]